MSIDNLIGLRYIIRSPFLRIYSIGGKNRIAEISNYPRAYKDTTPHLYTEDVLFTVAESHLNHILEGEEVYRDSKDNIFRIGEEATHWKGDSLPGAFPLWIESEELPFSPNPDNHVFPIEKLPGKKAKRVLVDARIKKGTVLEKLKDKHEFNAMKKQTMTDKITRKRKEGDSDRQIILIKYRRGR